MATNVCRGKRDVHRQLWLLAFLTRTGGLRPSGRTRALPVPSDKERLHTPGSLTTPGRLGTRDIVPMCVAFRLLDSVGTRKNSSFAAQWLACALPYRRFAIAGARLGASAVGIEMRRALHLRVRWLIQRFPTGPQSGSHHAHVSASPPAIPSIGISPTRF